MTDLETRVSELEEKFSQAAQPVIDPNKFVTPDALDQKIGSINNELSGKIAQLQTDIAKLVTGDALDQKINPINKSIQKLENPPDEANKTNAERNDLKNLIKITKGSLELRNLIWNISKISALILTIFLSVAAFYVLKMYDSNFQASISANANFQAPTPNNINSPAPNINTAQAPNSNINTSQSPTPNITPSQTPASDNNIVQARASKIDLAAALSLLAAVFALLHLTLVLGYRINAENAGNKIKKLQLLESKLTDPAISAGDVRKEYNEI